MQHAKLKDAYQKIVNSITDSLDFFQAISGGSIDETSQVRFYSSHEGLHLLYEQAQTRFLPRRERWYNLSTHMPWIGMRTAIRGGAHRIFPRHRQSDRREDRRLHGPRLARRADAYPEPRR